MEGGSSGVALWGRLRQNAGPHETDSVCDFDTTYARAIRATIDGVVVSVVALDDLIALKRAAGRVKDEEDVRALLALKDAKD